MAKRKQPNPDAVRLGKLRWASLDKAERAALVAALVEARAASATCYGPEVQAARARAGWATRRKRRKAAQR